MQKAKFNFYIDTVALFAFVLLTATGVLIRYVLPPGSGRWSTLWGMNRHDWGQIHFWISVVLLISLGLHLILHWRWIVCMVKGRPREGSGLRVFLALVGVLALVALAITPFFGPVEQAGSPSQRSRSLDIDRPGEHQISGSMTLSEIERRTGVPVPVILNELGIPPDIPSNERLGRLRRTYGFEINTVREIIVKHAE